MSDETVEVPRARLEELLAYEEAFKAGAIQEHTLEARFNRFRGDRAAEDEERRG